MQERVFIRQPGLLTITAADGSVYRGADQDWFPQQIQRWSGCGPTSASLVLCYLAETRTSLRGLYPEGAMDLAGYAQFMCGVWDFVTPGRHGLHRPEMYVDGAAAYAAARNLRLRLKALEVPAGKSRRPSFEYCAGFIRAGLEEDCPVAFLNLSNGKVADLDYWHWVTIIGMDGDMVTILDSGREFPIDLRLWYETTKKRGGFVALDPEGTEA